MVKKSKLGKNFSISVFFPCYNDAGSIGILVRGANNTLAKITNNFEIIVVDDGSRDESRKLLELLTQELPKLRVILHKRNRGYGGALKSGFAAARKKWVFYTDGDGQYDVGELPKLLAKIDENIDVVQGYKIKRSDPWYRIIIGRAYHSFSKFMFGLKVRDVDCDFRLIRRSAISSIDITYNSGVICVEMVKKLQDKDYRFVEVGVSHFPRLYGHSQFFNYKRIIKTFLEMAQLWLDLVIFKKV